MWLTVLLSLLLLGFLAHAIYKTFGSDAWERLRNEDHDEDV